MAGVYPLSKTQGTGKFWAPLQTPCTKVLRLLRQPYDSGIGMFLVCCSRGSVPSRGTWMSFKRKLLLVLVGCGLVTTRRNSVDFCWMLRGKKNCFGVKNRVSHGCIPWISIQSSFICQALLGGGVIQSPLLASQEAQLQVKLHAAFENEELLWRSKSRNQWLATPELNTRFFHLTTIIRRRRNCIEGLKSETGCWLNSRTAICDYLCSNF